jgi:HD-GYP domain-containing protein (c-di-GMP phosphodiesterase class II)
VAIEVNNSNRYRIGLNPNLKLNNYRQNYYFGNNNVSDCFQNNSPYALFNEHEIKKMVCENPKIIEILKDNRIPLNLNLNELMELKNGHCQSTQNLCVNIAKNLTPALRQQVNIKDLKDGAILHDFGKVLIPAEILNKNDLLTKEEHHIMNLHSELGYQLLKTTGINENVLNLVRYHHCNNMKKNYIPDLNLQILNLADKYSALTENRVYRNKLTPRQALTIIYKDVKKGDIEPELFYALVKSVQQNNNNPANNIVKKY